MARRSDPPAADPDLARFLRDELGVDGSDAPIGSHNWTFTGPVWVWRGSGNGPPPKAAWYFITIDGDVAASIRAATRGSSKKKGGVGFGSVRVTVIIGGTRWQTSLFPSKDSGGYLLPLKADVRKAERLENGSAVGLTLTLAD